MSDSTIWEDSSILSTLGSFIAVMDSNADAVKAGKLKLDSAKGDVVSARKQWLATTDNTQVTKLKAAIVAANERLAKLAEDSVTVTQLGEDEVKAIEVEVSEATAKFRGAHKALTNAVVYMGLNAEESAALKEKIDSYTVVRTRAANGTAAPKSETGIKRPRVNIVVTGDNFSETFETFTKMAARFPAYPAGDTVTKEFQRLYFEAADESGNATWEFKADGPEGKGQAYTAVATPKPKPTDKVTA